MKYWGLSTIVQSPFMAGVYAIEIQQSMVTGCMLSSAAFVAASEVAARTPAQEAPNLAIVHGTDAPPRRVYIRYPELGEWLRLERGTIAVEEVDGGESLLWQVVVDALH